MHLTVELVIGFFFLFIIVMIVGRKIINQITPFTFIAAIVLGELLGNALYDDNVSTFYIIYAMTLWGILLFIIEYLGRKYLSLQPRGLPPQTFVRMLGGR